MEIDQMTKIHPTASFSWRMLRQILEKTKWKNKEKIQVLDPPTRQVLFMNLATKCDGKTFSQDSYSGSDHPRTPHQPSTVFWAIERNAYNPVTRPVLM